MTIYEARVTYSKVVADGRTEALSRADLVVRYMEGAFDAHPMQESFWVIHLNRRNRPLGREMVTLGLAASTLAHPREVFRGAIVAGACAIVCVHNHPSGDPSPSAADLQLTRLLREAAATVDIPMLDHVVIGNPQDDPLGRGHYSFREAGLI